MENQQMVNARGRTSTQYVPLDEMNIAIDLLNDLIVTNRGIITIYDTAVTRLEDETNKELLQAYAEQHKTFVTELSNLVVKLGGAPDTGVEGSSLLKRAWVALKAAMTAGEGPILAEVAQAAANVLDAYGDVMSHDISDDVRNVIRRHLSEVRLIAEQLSGLKNAYNS